MSYCHLILFGVRQIAAHFFIKFYMELPWIQGMKLCSAGNTLSTKKAAMPIIQMSYCFLILFGVRHTTLSNRCAIFLSNFLWSSVDRRMKLSSAGNTLSTKIAAMSIYGKTHLNIPPILLQNQESFADEYWYTASGTRSTKVVLIFKCA